MMEIDVFSEKDALSEDNIIRWKTDNSGVMICCKWVLNFSPSDCDSFNSPLFGVLDDEFKWRFVLFPERDQLTVVKSLRMQTLLVEPVNVICYNWNASVIFSYMDSVTESNFHEKGDSHDLFLNLNVGYKFSDLLYKDKFIIIKATIRVEFHRKLPVMLKHRQLIKRKLSTIKMPEIPYKLKSKENETEKELNFLKEQLKDFEKLLKDKTFCDVMIKFKGEEAIPAHKCILAARSSFFATLFGVAKNLDRIQINDFSPEVIQILLKFIYTGDIDECNFENAMLIYQAADTYGVIGLKTKCENILLDRLTSENVSDIYLFANSNKLEKLKESASKIMDKNLKNNKAKKIEDIDMKSSKLVLQVIKKKK